MSGSPINKTNRSYRLALFAGLTYYIIILICYTFNMLNIVYYILYVILICYTYLLYVQYVKYCILYVICYIVYMLYGLYVIWSGLSLDTFFMAPLSRLKLDPESVCLERVSHPNSRGRFFALFVRFIRFFIFTYGCTGLTLF